MPVWNEDSPEKARETKEKDSHEGCPFFFTDCFVLYMRAMAASTS